MILKKLYLKNFLIHKETEVEFSENGITVFIGDNGAGKSSIIEGITYGLFGKSSKGNLADLVNWGKKYAEVHLEFEKDGTEFKIERTIEIRGKTAKSEAILYKKNKNHFQPYFQKNVNREIPKITGVSNKTFNTSVLVKQGDIEGILNLTPKERAKVLEDILDMSVYQLLSDTIGEKRRELEATLKGISLTTGNVEEIRKEINQLKKQQEQFEKQKKDVSEKIKKLEKEFKKLQEELKSKEKEKQKAVEILNKIENLKNKKEVLTESLKEKEKLFTEISEKEKQIEKLKPIVEELKEKENQIKLLTELEKIELKIDSLKEKIKQIEEDEKIVKNLKGIASEFEEKEKKKKEIDKNLLELQKEQGKLEELNKKREELTKKIKETMVQGISIAKALSKLKPIYKTLELNPLLINEFIKNNEEDIQKLSQKKDEIIQKKGIIKNQGDELKKRIEKINQLKGTCPTCERPLEEHTKEEILKELEKEIEQKRSEYKKILEEEKIINEKLKLEKEVSKLLKDFKSVFDKHQDADNERKTIDAKIIVLKRKLNELENLREEKREIEKFLEKHKKDFEEFKQAFNTLKRTDIEKIKEEFNKLSQEKEKISEKIKEKVKKDELQAQIEKLKEKEKEFIEIEQFVKQKENVEKQITSVSKKIKEIEKNMKDLEKEITEISQIEKDITSLTEEIERFSLNIENLKGKLTPVEIELAKILQEIQNKTKNLQEEEKKLEIIKNLKERIEKHKKLEFALGAKGIQKIIRDNVLYKLPNITNIIFSAFDFPFKQIKFTENFDISLLAPTFENKDRYVGINSISGGQKVALGLALRLAIGKFLTGKAEFLILDEPTIHLDEQRRNDLVNILLSIKSKNFVKQLIVITHDREIEDTADTIYHVEYGSVKSID
jgi:exonuclease SbcC